MNDNWETFRCRMPLEAYRLLEDELERLAGLANIDPEGKLSQEVIDGLALELMCANSRDIGDEEVV